MFGCTYACKCVCTYVIVYVQNKCRCSVLYSCSYAHKHKYSSTFRHVWTCVCGCRHVCVLQTCGDTVTLKFEHIKHFTCLQPSCRAVLECLDESAKLQLDLMKVSDTGSIMRFPKHRRQYRGEPADRNLWQLPSANLNICADGAASRLASHPTAVCIHGKCLNLRPACNRASESGLT